MIWLIWRRKSWLVSETSEHNASYSSSIAFFFKIHHTFSLAMRLEFFELNQELKLTFYFLLTFSIYWSLPLRKHLKNFKTFINFSHLKCEYFIENGCFCCCFILLFWKIYRSSKISSTHLEKKAHSYHKETASVCS